MLLYLLYKLNILSCLLCSRWDTNSHIQKSMTRSWGPACYMRTSGDRSLTCQTHSSRSVQQGNISYVMPIHQEQIHISETLSYVRLRHPDQYISETLSYVRPRQGPGNHTNPAIITFLAFRTHAQQGLVVLLSFKRKHLIVDRYHKA